MWFPFPYIFYSVVEVYMKTTDFYLLIWYPTISLDSLTICCSWFSCVLRDIILSSINKDSFTGPFPILLVLIFFSCLLLRYKLSKKFTKGIKETLESISEGHKNRSEQRQRTRSWIENLDVIKMSALRKLIYASNTFPPKNPTRFSLERVVECKILMVK